jgi:hypothetical protein
MKRRMMAFLQPPFCLQSQLHKLTVAFRRGGGDSSDSDEVRIDLLEVGEVINVYVRASL